MKPQVKIITSSRPDLSAVGLEFQTVLGEWLDANPNAEITNVSISNSGNGWILVVFYKN
jgi:hypothetical protein